MPVRTYRLYGGSITASTAAAAYLDIKRPGDIVGSEFVITPTGAPTTGDYVRTEVSFASNYQPTTNDAQSLVAIGGMAGTLTTSGGGWTPTRQVGPQTKIPVKLGDRLYLHVWEVGSGTYVIEALIHVNE